MSGEDQQSVQEFDLQQLQRVEAIKHTLWQVGDLISIQHTADSGHGLYRHNKLQSSSFLCSNSDLDYLQGVERAQALEGIRSYL